MSMEKEYTLHDTHCRSITALGSSIARRELYLGFEDGQVKSFELDSGAYVQTYWEHKGWISSFLYWPLTKLLFCASNDCIISAIGAGGNLMDRVFIGTPIYSICLNQRKKEVILGVTNGIQFHTLYETKEGFSHYINPQPVCFLKEHVDIVRCVVALESRAYTGGYDGSLVIYDCHINDAEEISATTISKNTRAHDAGIACLVVEKESSDRESSDILLFTGGFDKKVKVWTGEGKLIHKLEGFIYGITGICYVPKNKTICFNSGSAFIYDPKSGDDVTNFIDTFVEEAQSNLQLLKYIPEFHVMLETTSRRQLLVYRYNPSGCLTSLKCHRTLDSVCFTKKSPILIFTGDSNGNVLKWEQKQSNQLIYNSETMLKSEFVTRECSRMQGQSKQQQQKAHEQQSDPKTNDESNQNQGKGIKRSNIVSKVLYVESLDYLLAACEDGNIYVWGIDQEGVAILDKMKHEEEKANIEANNYMQDYMRLRENDRDSFDYVEIGELAGDTSTITPNQQSKQTNSVHKDESELVTNRVAGFVLKKVFSEHSSSVTSLVAIERSQPNHTGIYLLSAGWDRRVVIWDLVNLRIFDLFRNKHVRNFDEVELASEGSILDMCYCEKYDWFAYASTDSHCYVRRFSTCGSEMVLVNSLQGHRSDVNCVRWLDGRDIWVTGGEDNSIRIWSKDGEQLEAINCMGAVNSLCFDISQDVVIAACHDIIKVFELESYHLVQTCMGHHDSIRDVCFIPERNHIVSVSWDRSIRVWRSYRKSSHKRKKIETDSEKKFETWFWEQMKLALKNGSSYDVSSYSDNLESKD